MLEAAPPPPSRAYRDFVLSRPDAAETAAIRRCSTAPASTGARVHILHLSSARALDLIADAKRRGAAGHRRDLPALPVLRRRDDPRRRAAVQVLPADPRRRQPRGALAGAARRASSTCVVSDHSPATAEEKERGDGDLQQAWGGVSGAAGRVQRGRRRGRRRGIGIEQVSRWMSRSTADWSPASPARAGSRSAPTPTWSATSPDGASPSRPTGWRTATRSPRTPDGGSPAA